MVATISRLSHAALVLDTVRFKQLLQLILNFFTPLSLIGLFSAACFSVAKDKGNRSPCMRNTARIRASLNTFVREKYFVHWGSRIGNLERLPPRSLAWVLLSVAKRNPLWPFSSWCVLLFSTKPVLEMIMKWKTKESLLAIT